jgi:proteasome lid subunit RPN8/RPN11
VTGTLALAHGARAVIETACARARPREACGVLLGVVGDAAQSLEVHVEGALELANLACGVDEFAIDPGAIVAADARARSLGLVLAGFWHSHPGGPAAPSARDFADAWASCVTLVAAPAAAGHWRMRAFWRGATHFDELALVSRESARLGRLR